MAWLILAFTGPVLWAASTHIDKYLVERFFRTSGVGVLLVFTSLIGLVPLPVIWFLDPGVLALSWTAIGTISFSGLLYMVAMFFYLRALQEEEASVISLLFQTAPIFTYVLAYLVLHEAPGGTALSGGALIVAAAALVSFEPDGRGERKIKLHLVLLMIGCAISLALNAVIFKYFAIRAEFWSTTFWVFVGEAMFGVFLLAIPGYLKQFTAMFSKNPGAVIAINGANELINLGGGLAARFASLLGPLAIVQAISSTTPMFVFLFGVMLTFFLPQFGRENLNSANLLRKAAAVVLMVAGVALAGGSSR